MATIHISARLEHGVYHDIQRIVVDKKRKRNAVINELLREALRARKQKPASKG